LYNPTGTNVNLSGWYLTDDSNTPKKFRIPDGTTIPGHGYVFFDESQFNTGTGSNTAFAFSSTGESVYLFSSLTNGQLTGYSHGFEFGAVFNGVAFTRYVNSVGDELLPLENSLTFGATNSGLRIGPIVISEIQYHPLPGEDEFVELFNITSSSVPLFDPVYPTNTWKLSGLGYTFPTNISLGPTQLLLLVATNPAAFRTKYGVPAAVQILGPVPGALQNNGETLSLQAPDSPNTNMVPYVTIDEVRYNDKAPWPPDADGSGPSLQRRSAVAFGNDPINWAAASPTPGRLGDAQDSDGDGLPDWWEMAHGTNWKVADANADPDHDGFTNLQEFIAGTDPQDPLSRLKLDVSIVTPGTVTLSFVAGSNRTYTVQFTDSVAVPGWSTLADIPPQSTNGPVALTDPINVPTNRFYRLQVHAN
jgi:hypothetical protein